MDNSNDAEEQSQTDLKTMLNNRDDRQSNLLKKLCPNSGDCVSLGKFIPLLKQYFNDFNSQYAYMIRQIGESSDNGFVNAIAYQKNGYVAFCVLKTSSTTSSDNLFFEWWIGTKFINKLVDKFPCFVETYKILKTKQHIKDRRPALDITNGLITALNQPFEFNIQEMISESCVNPKGISILIQHLNPTRTMSFKEFILIHRNKEIGFNLFIFQILLQIYIPLGSLANNFTHNDLHTKNVLIYTLQKNQYVTLTYKFMDKTIIMKTQFIAKIIDYGRCYYSDYDNPSNSSAEFIKFILKNPECTNKNKKRIGYSFFEPPTMSNKYTSLLQPNITKDLRVLSIIGYIINKGGAYKGDDGPSSIAVSSELHEFMINKLINSTDTSMAFESTLDCTTEKPICNVISAMNVLCQIWLTHNEYINNLQDRNIQSLNLIPMGELTVYPDDLSKDSKFTAATSYRGGKNKTRYYKKSNKRKSNKRKSNKRKRSNKRNKYTFKYTFLKGIAK